jgi:hypothetical protein
MKMECLHRIINIVRTLLQCVGCFMIKSQKSKLCIETEAIETNAKKFIVNSFGSKCELCNSYRNSQQDATVYQNLLFHVYMKLNMFRVTHRPSSGAQNCTSSLRFCIRERLLNIEVAGRCQHLATSMSNNLSRMQNQRLLMHF